METKDIVTALLTLISILISSMTAFSLIQQRKADRDSARSDRFTKAIEHLKDESLAVRIGALYELKKLGLEDKEERKNIAMILSPFIRNGIVKPLNPYYAYHEDLQRPGVDIFIACEIVSLFFRESKCKASLSYLKAENLDLYKIPLSGADLCHSNFRNTILRKADLHGTDLRGAINLTAKQLVVAHIDDTTFLDPELRAEYDRLKSEQDQTPAN